jgi:hypothetical protein
MKKHGVMLSWGNVAAGLVSYEGETSGVDGE